jgi:hypothetical protein
VTRAAGRLSEANVLAWSSILPERGKRTGHTGLYKVLTSVIAQSEMAEVAVNTGE